jgi:hypothetical protein
VRLRPPTRSHVALDEGLGELDRLLSSHGRAEASSLAYLSAPKPPTAIVAKRHVISQSPKSGKHLPNGAKIALRVGM